MATIDNKGGVHGKAGSVIYRSYRGRNIMQGLPRRFKQTLASRESAGEFGMASSAAKAIRQAFQPFYHHYYDGAMINRVTPAVSRCIRSSRTKRRGERDLHDGDLSFLQGLEFNENSPLSGALQVKTEVSRHEAGQVVVTLPRITVPKDLVTPFKWNRVHQYRLSFVLVGFNFREEFFEYLWEKTVYLETEDIAEAQELVFEGEVPRGCLLLMMAKLDCMERNYYDGGYSSMNSAEFCPAGLIAAFQSADEAEKGYGTERLETNYDAAVAEGRVCPILPITGYQGNRFLARTRIPKGYKMKAKERQRRQKQEETEQALLKRLEEKKKSAAGQVTDAGKGDVVKTTMAKEEGVNLKGSAADQGAADQNTADQRAAGLGAADQGKDASGLTGTRVKF